MNPTLFEVPCDKEPASRDVHNRGDTHREIRRHIAVQFARDKPRPFG
jgi:hypothetical protein